jgi:hypothetical protein
MFLRAYRAAGVRVNMPQNNIKMDMKEIVLMTAWTELNLINIKS